MYGFTLIFTLAVVGGLIAYFGDKIGMKVGRKRLSLFGLRPKYTGMLITIVTGIFIAASSIAVLTIASNDVRTALFRMKSIQEALSVSRSELESTTNRIVDMELSLDVMVSERDKAASELAEVQTEMEEVRAQYDTVVNDLAVAKEEVQQERERVDYLREASEEMRDAMQALEERRRFLHEELELLLQEYEYLVEDYRIFENQVRYSNVALQADEIIYAQVFEGGGTIEKATEKLTQFLKRTDDVALRTGARLEGETESAIVLPQHAFDLAAHALTQHRGLVVVRAVSYSNTIVGEPANTYLLLIPNELIFLEGTTLAQVSVQRGTTADAQKQILALLGEANRVAISRGMITQSDLEAVEVSGADFLDTIARVKESDSPVTIIAKAAMDTWAAVGPLKLELEVVAEVAE